MEVFNKALIPSDVVFLFKSLNSMVDSELFIERLAFNDIERSNRNPRVFDPPRAKTNLGLARPIE
jgi:hypothetical protein